MIVKVQDLVTKTLKDEVIVFQTDTVYGIGCLLNSEEGVRRIYEIKKRDDKKPLVVLCANVTQVKDVVNQFDLGEALGATYWPGALTLILPKKVVVGDHITSGFNTVGVRIPNDKIALEILETFGPMAVTSLNVTREPSILKYNDVLSYNGVVDYIVEGIDLEGVSSTVYDCVNQKVLRQGEIVIN